MQITVEQKNVYGNLTVYPVCEQAKIFAALAGSKTLTAQSLKLIRDLGYSVVLKQQELAA